MATFDYVDARTIAEELLLEFGDTKQLVTKGKAGGRNAKGQIEDATPDTFITGLCSPLLDYDSGTMQGAIETNGSEIIAGDKYAYYHSDSEPAINMQLDVNGIIYRVQSVVWLSALDGTRIYTKLQLRS